ncbi:MAG TPA: ATP-binding cassette domain-containing protein, partial [Nocardioides sp.]|nr:ATP-binding cassette domain-containing protein [Nocardioides sp.]
MLPVVATEVVVKYGSVLAVDRVSLRIERGVTALLGPNGAGKSSLVAALSGALRPVAGRIGVGPHDPATAHGRRALRGQVGHLPQSFDLASGMTVLDTVRYAAWCNGLPRRELDGAASTALATLGLA